MYELLLPMPGFDRLTIDVVVAETGTDMGRFPSAGDLASWAGVAPGNYQSAGKRRNVGTPPGNRWLRRALIEAARAAARTNGSYFGAQYRQIARRRGPNKAAVVGCRGTHRRHPHPHRAYRQSRTELDLYAYPRGIKVSDTDLAAVRIRSHPRTTTT